jgi:hypothetical protein
VGQEKHEGPGKADESLRSQIEAVVGGYAASPLRIEFVDDLVDPVTATAEGVPGPSVLSDALDAILAASATHATHAGGSFAVAVPEFGNGRRAVVALTSDANAIEVSVRSALMPDAVGRVLNASVVEAVRVAGGVIVIEAAHGGGSLVTVQVRRVRPELASPAPTSR